MLVLNLVKPNIYKLLQNFKTSYVGIKLIFLEFMIIKICYFKTSYVGIKRSGIKRRTWADQISKHHMLVLNLDKSITLQLTQIK